MKKRIALFLVLVIVLSGCTGAKNSDDLMEGVRPNPSSGGQTVQETDAPTDFAVRLFQESLKSEENTLISPLSVLSALAMTANGAEEETLRQMEAVLGMSRQELNVWFRDYMAGLPNEKGYRMSLANSIWMAQKDSLHVEQDFLQTNADYFGADIYQAPFDDTTVSDINAWVKENTDEMIDGIIDEISEDSVMFLINALAFDAEWQTVYKEHQVRDGVFTTEDGTEQDAAYMYSTESHYLEDELATGFVKFYENRTYAFVALLPNEGVSVEEYASSLTGAQLSAMLAAPEETVVNAAIPKFETEYEIEMNEVLMEMGMTDAFDFALADFSSLGTSDEGNIFISKVLHKTFIEVGEQGTKAGAVTSVDMANGAAAPSETKTVYLKRPFIYMLVDCENNLPFFIGTMMDIEG